MKTGVKIKQLKSVRRICSLSIAITIWAAVIPVSANADPSLPDSSGGCYSAVLSNSLEMKRDSELHRWNLTEGGLLNEHSLSLMAADSRAGALDFFLKLSSGRRAGGNWRDYFFLKQGDLTLDIIEKRFSMKLFLRERIHYSRFMLLPVISSDSPFLNRNSEGLTVSVRPVRSINISYSGTRLSSLEEIDSRYGMPGINDGLETVNRISADFRMNHMATVGLHLSEMKPLNTGGDAVIWGWRSMVSVYGMMLTSEYCRLIRGDLSSISNESFRGMDPGKMTAGRIIGIFPESAAFSSELSGPDLGGVRFLAGYRYYGPEFINPLGNMETALADNYLLAYWKYPGREAMIDFKGGDIYYFDPERSFSYFQSNFRAYLKRGFELRGSISFRDGDKPSFAISMTDDGEKSSLSTGLRIDGGDRVSFISDGWLNLSKRWTLGGRIYLYRSLENRYNLHLSYRPSGRFIFRASAGSFEPADNIMSFERGLIPQLPDENRYIRFYARIWMGRMEE